MVFGRRLVLTYDSNSKTDGTGAQLQRIFALYALSKRYRIGFKNSEITSVAIHPLDSFQSKAEIQKYINLLNCKFNFPETNYELKNKKDVFYVNLNFRILLLLTLKSFILRSNIVLHVVTPYEIIDYCPNSYRVVPKYLPFVLDNNISKLNEIKTIAIHYRSGVGGMAVQVGEKFPREIPITYYLEKVNRIVSNINSGDDFKILVFTDAPLTDLDYRPPINQHGLWSNSPGFKDGIMRVLGNDLSSAFRVYGDKCTIIIGGNPLEAIELMSKSDYLIMGRSSFSYVAAILNQSGEVHFPPHFWHSPLSDWKIESKKS